MSISNLKLSFCFVPNTFKKIFAICKKAGNFILLLLNCVAINLRDNENTMGEKAMHIVFKLN